jgi:hypothetical protein
VRKRTGVIGMGLAALVLLSGCSVALDTYGGLPVDESGQSLQPDGAGDGLLTGEPLAVWVDPAELRFAVVLFGSSSCAPYPTSVGAGEGDQEITVGVGSPPWPICTADMAGTTYELRAPEGIDPARDARVVVDGRTVGLAAR